MSVNVSVSAHCRSGAKVAVVQSTISSHPYVTVKNPEGSDVTVWFSSNNDLAKVRDAISLYLAGGKDDVQVVL